jgi:tripartite ATP-independent transporter DctM subunit
MDCRVEPGNDASMILPEVLAILMVAAVCGFLFFGYPVALTLGGVSLFFAALGHAAGVMSFGFLGALPQRVFGVMTNDVLLAIPLFIFMGVMLERSRIAEELLETMGRLFGRLRGGLGISVTIVGAMLAASTGIVGATAVTMGLIVLPAMMRHGYAPALAAGTVAASATLAQIIPPSTVLVLLGDQLSTAYQTAQLQRGNFAPSSVTVSDLFAGAIVPGLALVALYILYLIGMAWFFPATSPAMPADRDAPKGAALVRRLIAVLIAPLLLILAVLGSILGGIATPTEAASVGAVGAMLLAAIKGTLWQALGPVVQRTTQVTCMIFVILIGATMFSLVFRGLGGDDMVHRALGGLPGGAAGAILVVMLAMFLLGFVMDAFEIIFVVVPIVAVPLLALHQIDPVWLGIMMAMNLQTSYMHPPLGPTLFFLRGVAPPEIKTSDIYLGIVPFVAIQLFALVVLWFVPGLATALPHALYGGR